MTVRQRMRRVLRLGGAGTRDTPRLSVIVPVYNVEQYLAECLDSILAQTFGDFEVVLVDDGSTDSSSDIAADYARRHSAVRVIASENRGLGAARNLGVSESGGELLTFVDSDDTVPPESFEVMLRALDESGSDFVVGSMKRHLPDGEYFHPPWLRMLHRRRRLGVVATDFPEILADVFAWNKIFRRGFWDREGLAFPEGVRYEDQVTTTEAYLTARSFDVIRMPVYFWRVRDDGTSITQRRHEMEDLRDRISTKRTSLRFVEDLGTPELRRVFYNFVLSMDLPSYFQELPGCGDDYWELLRDGLASLWEGAPPFSDAAMPVHYRLVAWLVVQGWREQAAAVADFAEQHRPDIPLLLRADHVVADLPYLDDSAVGIPAELYRLREREIPWEIGLAGVNSDGRALTIAGSVCVRRLPRTDVDVEVRATLVSEGGAEIALEVEPGDGHGAFTARLDLGRFTQAQRSQPEGAGQTWTVRVWSRLAGIEHSGGFTRAAFTPAHADDAAPDGVDIWFTPEGGLHVRRRQPEAPAVP
ncbi:MAG TPA: glycosyltransferase family 2 protein [Nocardioidaceae bacterium]|nr:glycosyltransferase family 2 protein [Nocardioidaceae bacterium]